MPPNIVHPFLNLAMWFCNFSKEVDSTYPALEFELDLYLLWPIEYSRSNHAPVSSLALRRPGTFTLLCACYSAMAMKTYLGEPAGSWDIGTGLRHSIIPAKAKLIIRPQMCVQTKPRSAKPCGLIPATCEPPKWSLLFSTQVLRLYVLQHCCGSR